MLFLTSPIAFSEIHTIDPQSFVESKDCNTCSTSMDRLSASFVGENYLNGGLQNALNESQTRRGALLEKLKDAQDTLQVRFSLYFKA